MRKVKNGTRQTKCVKVVTVAPVNLKYMYVSIKAISNIISNIIFQTMMSGFPTEKKIIRSLS